MSRHGRQDPIVARPAIRWEIQGVNPYADYHWHRQADDFRLVLGFSDPQEVPVIKTACGLYMSQTRITASQPPKSDLAKNPDLWCPGCFG